VSPATPPEVRPGTPDAVDPPGCAACRHRRWFGQEAMHGCAHPDLNDPPVGHRGQPLGLALDVAWRTGCRGGALREERI
jgi:hypothetical protein